MRSASPQSPPNWRRKLLGRRTIGLLLVLIVHILGLLMLFMLAPAQFPPPKPEQHSFELVPIPEPKPKPKPRGVAHKPKDAGGGAPHALAPRPKPAAVPKPAQGQPTPLDMMIMDKATFAAADIAKMPSHASDATAGSDGGSGSGTGSNSGPASGKGEGPGGEQLYNAEWYREPTRAEMVTYLPHNLSTTSWGEVACKTIPNYQVEDCHELGESPMGSGMSRALRQAAWQFRVRPPRVGGRPMIGAWVRIRYTLEIEPK